MPRRTIPPRAVSRTATSTSRRPRIWCAPPGPVQSPGSTIRSSTRTPSDVVVPTCRPARSRMWVIRRVTVLLPLVPEMETIGIRRSASRIQVGGVARASSRRAVQRASSRRLAAGQACRPRRRDVPRRPGRRRPRPGSAPARLPSTARSRSSARGPTSDGRPRPPAPRPGRSGAGGSRQPRSPRRPASRGPGPRAPSRTSACVARVALAVERSPPADGELQLDHRLQPVDVGTFEEAGLDQSHGPRRIASGPPR